MKAVEPGGETILLIDDEETVRTTITRMLQRAGYTVLEGADGEAGLAVFERERVHIDLVLLDLSMPRLSGEEVLDELRGQDADIAVVLLTGHEPAPELLDRVQGVIIKPVPFHELRDAVRAALGGQQSTS